MKCSWILAQALVLASVLGVSAKELYVNDFSTRRSAGPIQTGTWYSYRYEPGFRLAKNISGIYDPGSPWNGDNWPDSQDNWRKLALSDAAAFSCYCRAEGDNQYAEFASSQDVGQPKTGIIQPFYNSITDGVLRVRCDFKVPSVWKESGAYIRVQPLVRKHLMDMNYANTTALYNFGIQATSTSETKPIMYFGRDRIGGSDAADWGAAQTAGSWCRIVTELNLATGKITLKYHNLGATHPTLDQTTGSGSSFTGTYYLKTPMSDANGPIEGLAVLTYKLSSVSGTLPFDNLVCEWKKPGTTDFVRFYENDFTTRRYRTVTPTGTTDFTYATKMTSFYQETAGDNSSTLYANNSKILAAQTKDAEAIQPIGVDGWRRCNQAGDKDFSVVAADTEDGRHRLAASGGGGFVDASQSLGMTIDSGTLKAMCDFRTPDKWHHGSRQLYLVVGGDTLYKGRHAELTGMYYTFRVGISGTSDTTFYPTWSTAGEVSNRDTSKPLSPDTWYRVVVTLDKTANTYGFKMYEFGETSRSASYAALDSELICEKTGLTARYTGVVNSFSLWAYGAGDSAEKWILFDNVHFWLNGATNPFYKFIGQRQYRTYSRTVGKIVGNVHQLDYGQDHWVRRNNGGGEAFVTSGANPCLAGDAQNTFIVPVQAIGTAVKGGRIRASVDIRPPACWTWNPAGSVTLRLGGDTYLQCILGTNQYQKVNGIMTYGPSFGFSKTATAKWDRGGNRIDVQPVYYRGTGLGSGANVFPDVTIDTSHWYRFVATIDVGAHTYRVAMYDQGTAHPEMGSPNGPQVFETTEDVPFCFNDTEISSFSTSIYGCGVRDPLDLEDEGMALFDNLRIVRPDGMMVIVR